VGYSDSASGTEAFLWDAATGTMTGLGDLPGGNFFSDFFSRAYGINETGQVVGAVNNGSEAFLWDEVGGMRSLNDLIDPALG
jgi:probable HAF family extracellular repeat protein